ncbi:DUF4363 family protein [Paenibacillus tarimensis]
MKRRQIAFSIGLMGLLLLSPSMSYADASFTDPVIEKVQSINKLVEQHLWEQASQASGTIKQVFHKNKWKYQLLGDEAEYEQLEREIDKLSAAVHEKDSTQSKIIVAAILSILEHIYSF